MKTGIDIVKNIRIKNILNKSRDSFYRRIFTENEIDYLTKKNHDYKSVAGLYSAKEAISKVLGTGIGHIGFKDIEISHTQKGRPYVNISGKLKEILNILNLNAIDLSISHEDEYAIAFAIGYLKDPEIIIPDDIKYILPKRNLDTHKGTYGRVGIVAGSKGMTGAPYLSSVAALKSGSGLVYSIVPRDIEDIMSIKHTEVIVRGYESIEECIESIQDLDGLVLGPGLGQSEEKKMLVKTILSNFRGPVVLDADGINLIDDYKILADREGITVITPHPGEMANLLCKDIKEIQANRIYYSKYTMEKYNVISVLKGFETIVAYRDRIYINYTGNPGMATAGSGDVLAGMIISFICQGIDAYNSCILGTYCHGLAGDLAKYNKGEYGLIAGDILSYIPNALKIIQS